MRHPSMLAAATVALTLTAAGCGGSSGGGSADRPVDPNRAEVSPPGDIPDNQAFVAYAPRGEGYSVEVPEGWARTTAGGAVTFTDKLNSVRMESTPASGPPTVASAKQVEVPKLAGAVRGFKAGSVTSVRRKAGTAIRVLYVADGKPDQVTGKARVNDVERYSFFHKGRSVVLTLTGPKGADNVDPWKLVTDSLRFTR